MSSGDCAWMFCTSSRGTTLIENGVSCSAMLPSAPTEETVLAR